MFLNRLASVNFGGFPPFRAGKLLSYYKRVTYYTNTLPKLIPISLLKQLTL